MIGGSIGGLASGMDTASIISQLMQLEAIPQSRLKSQITVHQSAMAKLQELNTKMAALATKAADLAKGTGWSPVTAVSSYDKVNVTTTTGAQPTSLSFTVLGTAKAHMLASKNTAASLTEVVVTHAQRDVVLGKPDGTSVTINTGDGTLQSLIDAVNNANQGVRATAIKLDDGSYRLRVEATTTGAGAFTLTAANGQQPMGGFDVLQAGSDAQIKVGADTLSSPTNTFTNLLPGVNVTLAHDAVANTVVTATLATDSKSMTESVKGLIDSLNAILTDIDAATQTASGTTTKSGVLAGDSRLRTLRDQLVNTLYSANGSGLSALGVQLDKKGKFVFDEAKFKTAYAADPVNAATQFVAAATNTGFADRLATVAKRASRSVDGTISAAITGRKSQIDQLQSSVTAWDQRLELRRTTLTRQFTALETALGQMNSQSSWLAGQIASLPTSSSF